MLNTILTGDGVGLLVTREFDDMTTMEGGPYLGQSQEEGLHQQLHKHPRAWSIQKMLVLANEWVVDATKAMFICLQAIP